MGFFHKTINKVTGKGRIENQYQQSQEHSYHLENQMLANLYQQRCTQHIHVATQRQAVQQAKQQRTERFLQEKTLVDKVQAEQEQAFNTALQKIKEDMALIRAALYACRTGHADRVEALLNNSRTLRLTFFNLHPLHIAAENNQLEVVKLLCRYGVNLHRTNAAGEFALDLAAERGYVEVTELLHTIAKASEALGVAAKAGDIPAIKEALQRGADINATDFEGHNALQRVFTERELHTRHYQTIIFLVAAGADVTHQNNPLKHSAWALAISHLDLRVGAFFLLSQGFARTHHGLMEYQNSSAFMQESNLARLRTHVLLKNQGEQLKHQRGAYFFNGVSLVKTLEVPLQAVGNYFDFSDSLKHEMIYYLPQHQEGFYKDAGFAYCVSEAAVMTGDAIVVRATQQVMLEHYGYATPLFQAYYHNPIFNSIDEHLRLKRQAVFYRDLEGAYFFDGHTLTKVSSQPEGTVGNYFDFADFDARLKRQRVYYYPQHQALWYREKGFAYLVSEPPMIAGADKHAMLMHYASPAIAFYYEHSVLQRIDEHLTLQSEVIALREAPGEYFFDGDNVNKVSALPQWAVGNYFDGGERVKHPMIYYYPMHESTLYGRKGFAYCVSEAAVMTGDPIIVRADKPVMLWRFGYASAEMGFFYQDTVNCEQTTLPVQQAKAFLSDLSKHSQHLLLAAEQGDWEGVQASLLQGADVNITDEQGYNALQKAIMAKKISLELLNGLIEAGIELGHSTVALAREHLPELPGVLLWHEPVMGRRLSLTLPTTFEAQKARFQAHYDQTQRFLDKYGEAAKIPAMCAYYLWLSHHEPYAIYAGPALFLLSQLATAAKSSKGLANALKAAQAFFKRIRALHCLIHELGIPRATYFLAAGEFKETFVLHSVRLKEEAFKIASRLGTNLQDAAVFEEVSQQTLLLEGTQDFMREFVIQVLGVDRAGFEDDKVRQAAHYWVKHRTVPRQACHEKAYVEIMHQVLESGLVQLSPQQSHKGWDNQVREVQANLQQREEAFQHQKKALNQWRNQREAEYLDEMAQLERHLQGLSEADAGIVEHHQKAYVDLKAQFNQHRGELERNYQSAKHKLEQRFLKNCMAMAAAAVVAPQLAPSLAGKLGAVVGVAGNATTMATLELGVQGALTGALSAGFSQNTGDVVREGFMGGWLAGLGAVMGNVLEKSTTLQNLNGAFRSKVTLVRTPQTAITQGVVTHALVGGMKAALQVGVAGGELSTGVLTALGSSLALGGSKELSFVAKMNEQ